MRIALLSYEYPVETGFGGIGTYTRTQARALAALGHDVEVLSGAVTPGTSGVLREEGVLVRRHGDRERSGGVARLLGALGWWWSRNRLENARRMQRMLRAAEADAPFDVVEFPDCGGEGLRLDRGRVGRTVARLHSPAEFIMPYYDTRPGDRRLCAAIERRALGRADRWSACSRFLAEESASRGLAAGAEVIPNGIELDPRSNVAPSLREQLGVPREWPLVLFAGRLEPRKGVELLLELVPELLRRREVAFVVAGDDLFGHGTRELAPRCAHGLRGALHRLGRRANDEVRSALRQADVVFAPSRWESCPYAILEAMAAGDAGTAIVASRVGGVPELVRDGEEALLAAEGDAAAHLRALESLLDSPELRGRLGRAARRRAESDFSPRDVARRSLELYRRSPAGAES